MGQAYATPMRICTVKTTCFLKVFEFGSWADPIKPEMD